MKEEEIVLKVESYIKEEMYNESSGHDWWHVKRVHDLALKINEKENANEFTIRMIALLHDIYDDKFSDGNMRDKLIELMKKLNVFEEVDENKLENILFSIENLGFKGGFNKVELSKEGQIEISSEEEYRKMKRHAVNHFYEKLLKIKDTINTNEARNIAIERTKYMEGFLEEFYKEWNGKK